jgi:hypothetical protein
MTGITIEHAQIIDWTHARGGHPGIERPSEDTAQPIICFSNEAGVSWDEWISVFEGGQWVFIYEDRTTEGELSRSWRIIPRFAEESKWTHEVESAQAS